MRASAAPRSPGATAPPHAMPASRCRRKARPRGPAVHRDPGCPAVCPPCRLHQGAASGRAVRRGVRRHRLALQLLRIEPVLPPLPPGRGPLDLPASGGRNRPAPPHAEGQHRLFPADAPKHAQLPAPESGRQQQEVAAHGMTPTPQRATSTSRWALGCCHAGQARPGKAQHCQAFCTPMRAPP